MMHTSDQLVNLNVEGCNISDAAFREEFPSETSVLFTNLATVNVGKNFWGPLL
jgi:hypothetical protein